MEQTQFLDSISLDNQLQTLLHCQEISCKTICKLTALVSSLWEAVIHLHVYVFFVDRNEQHTTIYIINYHQAQSSV